MPEKTIEESFTISEEGLIDVEELVMDALTDIWEQFDPEVPFGYSNITITVSVERTDL